MVGVTIGPFPEADYSATIEAIVAEHALSVDMATSIVVDADAAAKQVLLDSVPEIQAACGLVWLEPNEAYVRQVLAIVASHVATLLAVRAVERELDSGTG